jgi:hypothetical protein
MQKITLSFRWILMLLLDRILRWHHGDIGLLQTSPDHSKTKSMHMPTKSATIIDPLLPSGTGDHRYVFLWYKQTQGKYTVEVMPLTYDDRHSFDFRQYAADHQLELFAVNFFYSRNDTPST